MGQHGLVGGADGKLLSLHEALKVEFERQVAQFKAALQKLEQLNLTSSRHGGPEKQVSGRPAPSEASHQRLLQVGVVCVMMWGRAVRLALLCCL